MISFQPFNLSDARCSCSTVRSSSSVHYSTVRPFIPLGCSTILSFNRSVILKRSLLDRLAIHTFRTFGHAESRPFGHQQVFQPFGCSSSIVRPFGVIDVRQFSVQMFDRSAS
ncbi:hypothetical protein LR48_Vigan03g006000 [Vigna angularis]|uniref:Uncharacterized protein n=1 Tax=Phaseolus angularis TaxID=3914 RepID=A0A0L9U2P2_PHAAN|nr:hypothetical protein LR48_Vigan03g006000 [Vigna angularis]